MHFLNVLNDNMFLGMDFSTVIFFLRTASFIATIKCFCLIILHNIIYVLKEHNTVWYALWI